MPLITPPSSSVASAQRLQLAQLLSKASDNLRSMEPPKIATSSSNPPMSRVDSIKAELRKLKAIRIETGISASLVGNKGIRQTQTQTLIGSRDSKSTNNASSSLEANPSITGASSKKDQSTLPNLAKWFNMPAPELTPELKKDLLIIKSRKALDPKRFYKKDHSRGLPKFFQIGTIQHGAAEFYSRPTRAERKTTMVEELMQDADTKRYFKKKFLEIQQKKESGSRKWYNSSKNRRKH